MTHDTRPVIFSDPDLEAARVRVLADLWKQAEYDNANGTNTWDSGEDVPDWLLPEDELCDPQTELYRADKEARW